MLEWWRSLTLIGQVFAAIAIPATIVMVLQSLLLLLGFGFDHDADFGGMHHDFGGHDGDGSDGLALFTVRGIVAFFSVGGWTGLVCVTGGLSPVPAVLIAFIAGSAALVGIALLLKYSLKLQGEGNLDIHNALGKSGTVYIPIPKSREGMGKVNILVQERLTEFDAVTDDGRNLKTGEMITVTEVINDQTVAVTGTHSEEAPKTNNNEEREGISKWIQ